MCVSCLTMKIAIFYFAIVNEYRFVFNNFLTIKSWYDICHVGLLYIFISEVL